MFKFDNPVAYSFTYEKYQTLVNFYLLKDSREINFQNRVIIPFFEYVFKNNEIDIADTSTLYYRKSKNSKSLDQTQFMLLTSSPPDLLITQNWNINNTDNNVTYLSAVEIKSPCSKESIFGKSFKDYHVRVKNQLNSHLAVNKKVILTDCYRWQFFTQGLPLESAEIIDLVDENFSWKYSNQILQDLINKIYSFLNT